MTVSVTLDSLIQRAFSRAGLTGARDLIPDDEAVNIARDAVSEWYDLLRGVGASSGYFRNSVTQNTTPDSSTIPLPTDFVSLLSVSVDIGGFKVPMYPFQEEDRHKFDSFNVAVWQYPQPLFYQMRGQTLYFIPQPQAALPVTINYQGLSPQLGDGQSTVDAIQGFDLWLVCEIARVMAQKANLPDMAASLQADVQKQTLRIMNFADQRDMGTAEVIHDRAGSMYNGGGRGGYGYGGGWE